MMLGLATPLVISLAFAFTGIGVFLTQMFIAEDSSAVAITKGFVFGVLAAVPTSVVGTIGGVFVLGRSGIRAILGNK